MKSLIPLFFLCSISPGFAAVTVFTTVGHPAINADADTRMVFLDAPDQQQNAMFGQLSNNPEVLRRLPCGLQQISAEQQQQLVEAWRGVIAARRLG